MSGRECQRWSSDTPHQIPASYTDYGFPEGSREAAENYCRNPDVDWPEGVWCYTTDVDKPWESCDVPECGEFVIISVSFSFTCISYGAGNKSD